MGSRFMLAFFTLSSLFFILHARPAKLEPGPLNLSSRSLVQSIADPPSEKEAPLSAETAGGGDGGEEKEADQAEAPAELESRKMGGHHSPDKSVAGGGVILGGLVTAIFAAVYCYIRVTRKRSPGSLT
ncbi:hypothetical protein ACP275_13G024000 [Erythranthe tilingii]